MQQLVCTECIAAYYLSETLYVFLIHGNNTLPNKTLIAILKQIIHHHRKNNNKHHSTMATPVMLTRPEDTRPRPNTGLSSAKG